MSILNIDKISSSSLKTDHFPYFKCLDCFSNSQLNEKLDQEFPEISDGGSFPKESLNLGENLKLLINELEGEEFKKVLEEKFHVDLSDSEVVSTIRGYSREKDGQIHTDSKSKILTVLLYLNHEWKEETGNLRMLSNKNDIESYFDEMSSESGNMIAFRVTENCWHGFLPFEGTRKSIQLNYVFKKSLSIHNLRHKLSAIFKKKT